jgi:hypothetical protein
MCIGSARARRAAGSGECEPWWSAPNRPISGLP